MAESSKSDDNADLSADSTCPPPYRDGKIHVLSERCSTCVFRPGNLMGLAPGRLTGMVKESIAEESAIICHQTLPYGFYDVPGQAVCRGFFDRHGDKVASLRLAQGLGLMEEQDPPTTQDAAS